MRRRHFIAGLGAAALAPRVLRAQQPGGRQRRLGVLMGILENGPEGQARADTVVKTLAELGWAEGGNLRIDWRRTGDEATLAEHDAEELIGSAPEVILAGSSVQGITALKQLTSTIPIVFANVIDPVGQGFVANLAHPEANLTGFSAYDPGMAGKWVELLTQLKPAVARVAVIFNPDTTPYSGLLLDAITGAASALGVTVRPAPLKDDGGIAAAMGLAAREARAGVLALPCVFTTVHREVIVQLAAQYRVPAVYPYRYFAAGGGLMSYGIDPNDLFRRAAVYVDRILKGETPAGLPVEAPTKFELVVNLKTAKALEVSLPSGLIASANEVIQ